MMTVDIQDYASLVSGSDWSAALQAAVNSGHKVLISEGEYEIHSAVNLPDNCFIEGEHPVKSILKSKKQTYGSQKIFNAVSKKNITIRNLVLNGNAADVLATSATLPSANTTLVYLKTCENVTLDNLEIKNFTSKFDVSPTDPSLLIWSSLFIYQCTRVKLTKIYQHHCKTEGVYITDCNEVLVNELVSEKNLSNDFNGYSEGDLGSGYGESKEIWTPLAVIAYSQTAQSKNITITNCKIDGSGGSLVNLSGEHIVLSNLRLSNAAHDFIDLGREGLATGEMSKHVTITNVICSDSRDIKPTANSAGLLFAGFNLTVSNFVAQNVQSGIFIGAENVVTKRVTMTDIVIDDVQRKTSSTKQAIGLQIARCEDVSVSNASVNNVYDYGVLFYEANYASLINSCIRNVQAINPISIYNSHKIKVKGANIDNSAVTGYSLMLITDQYSSSNGCTYILVSDCYLAGTTSSYGISLDKSLNTSCFNNFGRDQLYQTNGNNAFILSSQDNINYRTPLRWGDSYLYIDDTAVVGKVRVEGSAPTSSTDGTVVGVQS